MDGFRCDGVGINVRQKLWNRQQQKEFCDIILETDSEDQVWVHRVVVSTLSPVFHSLLLDKTLYIKDEKSGMDILRIPGIKAQGLNDVVRFAYLGNIDQIRTDTVALWDRFQINEPLKLFKSENTTENTSFTQDNATESVLPTDIKIEDKVKTDDFAPYNDDTDIDLDYTSPNETLEIKETSSKSNNDDGCNTENHTQCKKRKRKCASFKFNQQTPLPSLDECSSLDISDSSDEDFEPQVPIKRPRGRPRKKPLVTPNTTLSTVVTDCIGEDVAAVPHKRPRRHPRIIPISKPLPRKNSVRLKNSRTTHKRPMRKPKLKSPTKRASPALCTTCNIEFETVKLYKEHKETMHRPVHKCTECTETFIQSKQLKAHRLTEHYKEGLPQPTWHYCVEEGCHYKTIYKYALYTHGFTHTKEKVICETCGAMFSRQQSLRKHVITSHGVGPTHLCDQCDKGFYSPSLLKAHQDRIHQKALRVLCDQCPFMGFDKESVAAHAFRRHGVPLPGAKTSHTCPYCGYKSPSGSNMRDHIERHEPQDYNCDQCDSVFPCRRDLRAHRSLLHTQRKRVLHPCQYEGCKFISKYGPSVLKKHVSRMHEQKDYKPWECSECAYKTNVKGNLHLHMRNVHKLRPETNQRRLQKVTSDSSALQTTESAPNEPIVETPAVTESTDLQESTENAVSLTAAHQLTAQSPLMQHNDESANLLPPPQECFQDFHNLQPHNLSAIYPHTHSHIPEVSSPPPPPTSHNSTTPASYHMLSMPVTHLPVPLPPGLVSGLRPVPLGSASGGAISAMVTSQHPQYELDVPPVAVSSYRADNGHVTAHSQPM